jgi:hypothetical protein
VQSRTDNPGFGGAIVFTGNRVTIELLTSASRDNANLIRIAGPTSAHSAGGVMKLPELIDLRGNDVRVINADSVTRVNAVIQENLNNLTDGIEVAGEIHADAITLTYDDHAPQLRFELAKHANFDGAGWRLFARNVDRLRLWAGAHSGAGGPEARLDVWAENIGNVNLRHDFGGLRRCRIIAREITRSSALGLHSPIGDEDWALHEHIPVRDYSFTDSGRDFDLADETQWVGNSSNASAQVPDNAPTTGLHCWAGWHHRISDSRAVQFAVRVEIADTTPQVWVRTMSGSTWRPWVQMIHNGMTLPSSAPAQPGRIWRDAAAGGVLKQT